MLSRAITSLASRRSIGSSSSISTSSLLARRPTFVSLLPSLSNPASPRLFSTSLQASAAPSPSRSAIPPPKPKAGITDPASFLSSISSPPRRDLASDGQILSALGDSWKGMWKVDGTKLKGAGVNIKDRKYVLWALEKYRQGLEPSQFVTAPKPRKKIRGWGPRVQKGIRVRGRRRLGEK